MSRMMVSAFVLVLLLGMASILTPTAEAASVVEAGQAATLISQAQNEVETTSAEAEGGSGLPEGLSRIFASLGLYITTMFTMAIGTEIMVDVFKLIVGLRSKPKARDTLADYESLLPGTLESLGVGAEAQHNLAHQLDALKNLLQPVLLAEDIVVNLRQQHFDAALAAVISDEEQAQKIETVETAAKNHIATVLTELRQQSGLGQLLADHLQDAGDELVTAAAAQLADLSADELMAHVAVAVNGRLAETVTDWADGQLRDLRALSYQSASRLYTTKAAPLIETAGLSDSAQAAIKRQFDELLHNLSASQQADIYLASLNKLLLEVEHQRDELAAIWRKGLGWITRRLRQRFPWLLPERPQLDPTISEPDAAATKLLEIERRDKREEKSRIQQLRLVSVVVGVVLAYSLQIDSADLLGDLFPPDANFLSMVMVPAESMLFTWLATSFNMQTHALTAGIVLTGLAASAGSGFWHDQLTRLQSVKQGVETAYRAIQPVIAQVQPPETD